MGSRGLINFIGFGLLGISCYFSAHVLVGFGNTQVEGAIYAFCGVMLQLGSAVCFLKAFDFYYAKNSVWSICAACYVVLTFISIHFTMSNMAMTDTHTQMKTAKVNTQYNSIQADIAAIDAEIKTLQETAEKYKTLGRYKSGVFPTMDRIEALRDRKANLVAAIPDIEIESNAQAAIFASGAEFFSIPAQSMKSFISFVIAVAIDFLGCFLLALGKIMERYEMETRPIVVATKGTPAGNGHGKKQQISGGQPDPKQAQKPLNLKGVSGIDPDIMAAYLEAAHNGGGQAMTGINKSHKLAGIKQRQANECLQWLKQQGFVDVSGRQTIAKAEVGAIMGAI